MPFLDGDGDGGEGVPALPDSAAHAAEVVGRAAASAKHALENAFKRLPGR